MLLLNEQLSSLHLDELADGTLYNVAYRTVQDNVLYYSRNYKRVKLRNSYNVRVKDDRSRIPQLGQLQFFLSILDKVFAFVLKLQAQPVSCQEHFSISHDSLDIIHISKIVPIEHGSERLVCNPASNLVSKCVFIAIDDDLSKCQYVI